MDGSFAFTSGMSNVPILRRPAVTRSLLELYRKLQGAIQLRRKMEKAENRHGNYWFHVPIIVIGSGFAIYWYLRVPSPGKALLVLSAIVAVMMFLEMRPLYKALYVVLIIGLVVVENRATDKDRTNFATAEATRRAQLNNRFQGIANEIKAQIDQSQAQFAQTMSGIKRNINTVTGGDSFCYLDFAANGTLPTFVQRGKYPISDVSARIVDLKKFDRLIATNPQPSLQELLSADTSVQLGELTPNAALVRGTVKLVGQSARFNIFFSARNGFWTQKLRLRLVGGKWVRAIRVTTTEIGRDKKGPKKLFEKIDKGFPRNAKGEVDW
jgi:hypothetical protein